MTAAFDGGAITSNGGALLLRETDRRMGLFERVAACFTDRRDPRRTEHSLHTLVAQRITGFALGDVPDLLLEYHMPSGSLCRMSLVQRQMSLNAGPVSSGK